jgi:hypothetical protein
VNQFTIMHRNGAALAAVPHLSATFTDRQSEKFWHAGEASQSKCTLNHSHDRRARKGPVTSEKSDGAWGCAAPGRMARLKLGTLDG